MLLLSLDLFLSKEIPIADFSKSYVHCRQHARQAILEEHKPLAAVAEPNSQEPIGIGPLRPLARRVLST